MKRALRYITLVDMLFILALSFFASFDEPISLVLRIAFALVVAFIAYRISLEMREERERVAGVAEESVYLYRMKGGDIPLFASLVIPTVGFIFAISIFTSFLLGLVNLEAPAVANRPFLEMLIVNCLVPVAVEEIIFRYIPMKLLAPYSKRWCIILSALFFALAHLNVFQIPYAFIAGVIFMALNLLTDSIIPSILLHVFNNVISILYIKYSADVTFNTVFIIVLAVTALISLVPLVILVRKNFSRIKEIFVRGEPLTSSYAPILFVIFTLFLAIYNLF